MRFLVAGSLVATAVVWASHGFASGDVPALPRGGSEHMGVVQEDAKVFLAFEKVKLEQLREYVQKGDQESALRLEERLHKEEVRFLERAIWACNQEKALQGAAFSMIAYLDNFKGMPAQETLRAKVASNYGTPEVFTLAMHEIGQPPGQRPGANASGAVAQFSGDPRFTGPAGAERDPQFAGGPGAGGAPFAGDPRLAGPGGEPQFGPGGPGGEPQFGGPGGPGGDPRLAGPGGIDPRDAQLAGAPGDPRFAGPGGLPPGAFGPPGSQPLGAPPFPGAPGGQE